MPVSEEFMEYLKDQLSSLGDVTLRKMFGGAGVFLNGKVFGLVADDTLYLKVDDSNRKMYLEAGAEQFRPFSDKELLMPYYRVHGTVLEDAEELCRWADESIKILAGKRGGK